MTKTPVIFKSAAGREAILAIYPEILARWPQPFETLRIPSRLGNTFVAACGDPAARPLILLHGSSSNVLMWTGDVQEYAQHFRIYAPDIPGEPGQSEPVRPPLAESAYSDWLLDLFQELGIQDACLAGISLGGWMALKFATAHPERVQGLALMCPAGICPQKMSFLVKTILYSLDGKNGRDSILRMVYSGVPIPDELMAYIHRISEQFSPRMEVIPLFSDAELGRLDMPVLLYAGEKDTLLPSQKTAERLGRLLPHAEIHLLPDAGHVLVGLAGPIDAFFRKNRQPAITGQSLLDS
ncbi:predicted hydrolase [Longilinea arvoryzae]|uniref:Predicted hydrolase n=1 Tax=Longilinea arvoryzae TaxID=360412 RepID=A0A0S7BHS1_9CHLR|nr:alpha/beta fold hydrolase [Longilinea arvoryzae]GAP13317.1 predicted hydrolase [Longilinea arvoryzae]